MESEEVLKIVRMLSKSDSMLGFSAKKVLEDNGYSPEWGLELLECVYSQMHDNMDLSIKMYGEEVNNDIIRFFSKDYNFIRYMEDKGYYLSTKELVKGFCVVNLSMGGKRVRIMSRNTDHKHPYVGTCLAPTNRLEADVWYKLFEMEKREIVTHE